MKGFASPRPLTHDLIVNVVENLGGEFQDVVISELKDGTYYARLRVRHDGELVEIDARPSDAIAVAVTCNPRAADLRERRRAERRAGGAVIRPGMESFGANPATVENVIPTTSSVPLVCVNDPGIK